MTENIKTEIIDGMTVMQDSRGLILTTDACLLSSFVNKNAKDTCCELCAGSGIVSVMLINYGKAKSSVCVDFQPDVCKLAEENVKNNGLDEKIKIVCKDVIDYTPDKKFDKVVCNPPYFRKNCGYLSKTEQDLLSRHETTATVFDFAVCASRILKDGGDAYFCYTPQRSAELIYALKSNGLEPKNMILVYPTKDHSPSLLLLSAKKAGAEGMTVKKPLIIYKDKAGKEFSEDYIRIKEEHRTDFL